MSKSSFDVIALLLSKANAFDNASASKRTNAMNLRKEADALEETADDEAEVAIALRNAANSLGSS